MSPWGSKFSRVGKDVALHGIRHDAHTTVYQPSAENPQNVFWVQLVHGHLFEPAIRIVAVSMVTWYMQLPETHFVA